MKSVQKPLENADFGPPGPPGAIRAPGRLCEGPQMTPDRLQMASKSVPEPQENAQVRSPGHFLGLSFGFLVLSSEVIGFSSRFLGFSSDVVAFSSKFLGCTAGILGFSFGFLGVNSGFLGFSSEVVGFNSKVLAFTVAP